MKMAASKLSIDRPSTCCATPPQLKRSRALVVLHAAVGDGGDDMLDGVVCAVEVRERQSSWRVGRVESVIIRIEVR